MNSLIFYSARSRAQFLLRRWGAVRLRSSGSRKSSSRPCCGKRAASVLATGEQGRYIGPEGEVLLAFVHVKLVQLAQVAHARQIGFLPPACQRLVNTPAGRGR